MLRLVKLSGVVLLAAATVVGCEYLELLSAEDFGPGRIVGLVATPGDRHVALTWTDPDDRDLDLVQVSWQPSDGVIRSVTAGVQSFTATDLENGTTYVFSLRAVDMAGNTSTAITVTATPQDTTAPEEVTGAVAVAGDQEVTLTWHDPTDTDLARVLVTWTPGGTVEQRVAPGVQALTVTGLVNGTTYTFAIAAEDHEGNTSAGVQMSSTPSRSMEIAAAPTGLRATPVSDTSIELQWTDGSGDETGFRLQRRAATGGSYGTVVEEAANVVTFTDQGLAPRTEYVYRIAAISDAGVSGWSNQASAATFPPPGLAVSAPETLEVHESGGDASLQIALDSPPLSTVTVTLQSSDLSEGVPEPAAIAFDRSNWDVKVTVAIRGTDDDEDDDDVEFTIGITSSSADARYEGLAAGPIDAVNRDDDSPPPWGTISGMEPANGTRTADTTPLLAWDAVGGAARYDVQIADSVVGLESATVLHVSTNELVPATSLGTNRDLYWRVRAVDGTGRAGQWSTPYAIELTDAPVLGETGPAGGIVFYDKGSYSAGWRYLEAARNDVAQWPGTVAEWGARISVDVTSTAIGTGKANTAAIVAALGSDNAGRGSQYAALLCAELDLGGYRDWYLPSIEELATMYDYLFNSFPHQADLSSFYWSSSEYSHGEAWFTGSYLDLRRHGNKTVGMSVRPIRSF